MIPKFGCVFSISSTDPYNRIFAFLIANMDLHDSFAIIEDEKLINDGLIPLIGPLINHVPYPKNFSFPRLPSKEFKLVLISKDLSKH